MNLAGMAVRNLARHPIRTGLTVLGVACAAATVFAILGFDRGYERALRDELTRTGVHLFVSTEGCPSVAATMLIRGGELPRYMTDAHLAEARTTPGVRLAGGYLIATGIPPEGGGIDLFFGITEEVPRLKPEWHLAGAWFSAPDAAEAILGATMAAVPVELPLADDGSLYETMAVRPSQCQQAESAGIHVIGVLTA